ncbi:hypothetical protein HAX54_050902 [Datura stramonium]|uniref:Uncharacterized protein n=1 Tax=Datura stramonium TaxID=4076 RepID=A0ABS8SXS4_DATST|nr:hypothetical protein [Datura stramonium]
MLQLFLPTKKVVPPAVRENPRRAGSISSFQYSPEFISGKFSLCSNKWISVLITVRYFTYSFRNIVDLPLRVKPLNTRIIEMGPSGMSIDEIVKKLSHSWISTDKAID